MGHRWEQATWPLNPDTMLLLTDGSILVHDALRRRYWQRLRPNAQGDYRTSTDWTVIEPMHHGRLYFASAVLADGTVFVAGGEYLDDSDVNSNLCEIFDPVLQHWFEIDPPPTIDHIGDSPCCVLFDGRVLVGAHGSPRTALYDPLTSHWQPGADKHDPSDEETWTLLPDGSVLCAGCTSHPAAERYIPDARGTGPGRWVSTSNVDPDIVDAGTLEIGPALLMDNKKVFAVGANGHTSLFNIEAGRWEPGPDFPLDEAGHPREAKDAPGCLLPSGKVLCVAEKHVPGLPPASTVSAGFSQYCLYDPRTNRLGVIDSPDLIADRPTYYLRMLLLPNGEVAVSSENVEVSFYNSDEPALGSLRPVITSVDVLFAGFPNRIAGRGFNGISQANSYGDDATMATNYPLARLRDPRTDRVWYFRTHDHSSMGVQVPGEQSTFFDIPFDFPVGNYCLEVVANGVPSLCTPVTVAGLAPRIVRYRVYEKLFGSLADGDLFGVVGNHVIRVPEGPNDPAGLVARARAALGDIQKSMRLLAEIEKEGARARMKEYQETAKAPIETLRQRE